MNDDLDRLLAALEAEVALLQNSAEATLFGITHGQYPMAAGEVIPIQHMIAQSLRRIVAAFRKDPPP